jgi:hypothetical protein
MGAKRIVAGVGEYLLIILAIVMMVPPYPSEKGYVYSYFPAGVYVAILAAASRLCALAVGRERWLGLLIKTALIVGAGFVVHSLIIRARAL